MKTSLLTGRILTAACLLMLAARPVAAADTVLKFSDPTQPGRLVLQLGFGDVTIVGGDSDEIRISSEVDVARGSAPREDGMRRLDGDDGYSATEADNVVTVTFANAFPGGRRHGGGDEDIAIVVPRQTHVTLERGGPGDVSVQDLSGNLEIRGAIGDVELEQMSGGVLVESVNGDVKARFARLATDRPVSITVVHGDVSVTVPADAQANVQLRTLRGEMLTDFGEDQLQTRFENNPGAGMGHANQNAADVENAGRDRERAERDRERADRDRQRADIERNAAADAAAAAGAHPSAMPMPPRPPMPPMPPMSGGKLVVGTLNGGGTELIIATITGDIALKKAE